MPMYAVLNFCRVLAFINEGLITSKAEGAEWALKQLPPKFAGVIRQALYEYIKTGSSLPVDNNSVLKFAKYANDQILKRKKSINCAPVTKRIEL